MDFSSTFDSFYTAESANFNGLCQKLTYFGPIEIVSVLVLLTLLDLRKILLGEERVPRRTDALGL